MVFVLADDFSGAAEIGGIGHRYGLRAEIQLGLDKLTTAETLELEKGLKILDKLMVQLKKD